MCAQCDCNHGSTGCGHLFPVFPEGAACLNSRLTHPVVPQDNEDAFLADLAKLNEEEQVALRPYLAIKSCVGGETACC